MKNENTSEKQNNESNNQTIYKKTEYINIDSVKHNQLIKRIELESENKILSLIIKKCDIEVFNNKIIVLRFPIRTIYSEQAELRKKDFNEIFSKIVKKPVEVTTFVATLNNQVF